MNHCFMSCKHRTQLPRYSSVAVSHIQRLTPKERGSEKRPYVVMVVSEGFIARAGHQANDSAVVNMVP